MTAQQKYRGMTRVQWLDRWRTVRMWVKWNTPLTQEDIDALKPSHRIVFEMLAAREAAP